MAMACKQCGGAMMCETVIALRRGFFGFRETRSQGAYCVTCKIAVPIEDHPSVQNPPIGADAQACGRVGAVSPTWLRKGFARASDRHTGALPMLASRDGLLAQ
jgi:hypothetical protein